MYTNHQDSCYLMWQVEDSSGKQAKGRHQDSKWTIYWVCVASAIFMRRKPALELTRVLKTFVVVARCGGVATDHDTADIKRREERRIALRLDDRMLVEHDFLIIVVEILLSKLHTDFTAGTSRL
jgi:hypothetical protein